MRVWLGLVNTPPVNGRASRVRAAPDPPLPSPPCPRPRHRHHAALRPGLPVAGLPPSTLRPRPRLVTTSKPGRPTAPPRPAEATRPARTPSQPSLPRLRPRPRGPHPTGRCWPSLLPPRRPSSGPPRLRPLAQLIAAASRPNSAAVRQARWAAHELRPVSVCLESPRGKPPLAGRMGRRFFF